MRNKLFHITIVIFYSGLKKRTFKLYFKNQKMFDAVIKFINEVIS